MPFDLVRKDPDDIKGYEVSDDDKPVLELVHVVKDLMAQGYQHCDLSWKRLAAPDGDGFEIRFQVAAAPPVGDEVVALEHHVLVVTDGNQETGTIPTVAYADSEALGEQYNRRGDATA